MGIRAIRFTLEERRASTSEPVSRRRSSRWILRTGKQPGERKSIAGEASLPVAERQGLGQTKRKRK